MTEAEIDEAVHLAMTVGASKTLMLAKGERRGPVEQPPAEGASEDGEPAPFAPAEVVASSEDG